MKLAETLSDLVDQLRHEGVDFAVIGGLAASARGEARFTRDVDIAVSVVRDAEAERLIFKLSEAGYEILGTVEQDATTRLAAARLRHDSGVVCDLMFATSGIEPEIVDSAKTIELFPQLHVPTASAETLLAMKTLSATPQRPRDLGDIRAILGANPAFDESVVRQLLELMEARGYGRGQTLVDKWEGLLTQLSDQD